LESTSSFAWGSQSMKFTKELKDGAELEKKEQSRYRKK
jgi:hypothetical protein